MGFFYIRRLSFRIKVIAARRQPLGCAERLVFATQSSLKFVCLYVCMYVRTNEMSAQMKLQNVNFKNMLAEGTELGTSTIESLFASI